jgi:hypothetical protein
MYVRKGSTCTGSQVNRNAEARGVLTHFILELERSIQVENIWRREGTVAKG